MDNTNNTHTNGKGTGYATTSLPLNKTSRLIGTPTQSPSQVQTITPARAKQLLDTANNHNRKISDNHVGKLTATMRDGRWQINGETIKIGITKDGKEILLDGQHRLMACVRSNRSFTTHVIIGLDPEFFDTIDQGKKRNMGDVFSVDGHKDPAKLASALPMVDMYFTDTMSHGGVCNKYPNDKARKVLKQYPTLPTSVEKCVKVRRSNPIADSIMIAAHYIFAQIDEIEADEFLNKMGSGTDMKQGDPILALREAIIRNKARGREFTWTRVETLAGLIKTWNHVRFDRTVTKAPNRFKGDMAAFPRAK